MLWGFQVSAIKPVSTKLIPPLFIPIYAKINSRWLGPVTPLHPLSSVSVMKLNINTIIALESCNYTANHCEYNSSSQCLVPSCVISQPKMHETGQTLAGITDVTLQQLLFIFNEKAGLGEDFYFL